MTTTEIDTVVTDTPPSGWGYQSLLIRQIRRDGGTQARVGLNEDTVQEYAELMREQRWDFQSRQRPIVLFDGDAFWLADGFHRIEAAQRAGLTDYLVDVIRGNQRDAILRAAGANSQHGLRRTNADKRRAVELLLRDDEWRQWSDRKIADVCAVSDKTVAAIRRDLSAEFPQIQTRTVERKGTSYQMTPAAPKPGAINRPDGSPSNGAPPAETRVALVAAHQAELADMQQRFAVFDWKLTPHGLWYKLSKPDGTHYGTISDSAVLRQKLEEMERSRANRIARGDPAYREPAAAPATELTPEEHRIVAAAGYEWQSSDVHPGKTSKAVTYHFISTGSGMGVSMTRPQFDAWLKIHTPIERAPIETDNQAMITEIRTKAGALGLGVIWEDDTVILHWPDEDIDQLLGMGYQDALYWLAGDGVQQAEQRAAKSTAHSPPAVPPRPRRTVSADVSAQVAYVAQLEAYASALESFIMELQRRAQ